MTSLVRYDAARKALAEAHRVDEVKDIRDKALAIQNARQAKDRDMIEHATEIRLRAERRAAQLLGEMNKAGDRARGGGDLRKELRPATLSDLGVTKTQSSRWQKLGALDDQAFEQRTAAGKRQAVASVDATSMALSNTRNGSRRRA